MRQRVRAKRLKLGMSQAELGHRVGISRVSVCEFESGRGSLSDSTVERMLDVLDIDTARRVKARLDSHLATLMQLPASVEAGS